MTAALYANRTRWVLHRRVAWNCVHVFCTWWSFISGHSVDASGQHILIGVVISFPPTAQNMQLENGRLATVNEHAPTNAVW